MTQPTIEEPLGGAPQTDTTVPPSLPPQLSPRAIARARRRQAASRAWMEYRRNSIGLVGLAILVLFVAMAVFAPLLVPESELDVTRATGTLFSPPSKRWRSATCACWQGALSSLRKARRWPSGSAGKIASASWLIFPCRKWCIATSGFTHGWHIPPDDDFPVSGE